MKIHVSPNTFKILVICSDPIEFDDIHSGIVKLIKNYMEDHHYDE